MVVDSNARSGISTRTLPLQYLSLAFLAVWLFATQIPLSLFVSTRSVQVSAFINGIKISDGFVKTVERALGTKTRYKDYDYRALRLPLLPFSFKNHSVFNPCTVNLLAILPWFAFLFTLAAAVVSFLASSHARRGKSGYKSKAAAAVNTESKSLPAAPTSAA
jgi:hypothetical protein